MGKHGRAPTRSGPAAETPLRSAGQVVGCGSMADGQHLHESIGGKPGPVAASGRDRCGASSSLGSHTAVRDGLAARAALRWKVPRGTQWGQTDGREPAPPSPRRRGASPPGRAGRPRPRPLLELLCPSGRAAPARDPPPDRAGRPRAPALTIVTWLILPVVICLSQRLSHACLSISNYTVKLRMAH
jgi:hypothetical protein